jgi:alanine racemase
MTLGTVFEASNDQLEARVWAEINLGAIASNVKQLRRYYGNSVKILAVVKANGYGLGAEEVGRAALGAGAMGLAVACAEEGFELRTHGLDDCLILVLGYVPPSQYADAIAARLILTVGDIEMAQALSREAARQGTIVRVQLKLDTGFHRGGIEPETTLQLAKFIRSKPFLELNGLYTHFATGDEPDPQFVHTQYESFQRTRAILAAEGFSFAMEHCSNSATSITVPEARINLVRVGLALLGYYPSETVEQKAQGLKLNPCLTLKSRIVRLHWAEAGETVGYGRTFTTTRRTLLALVPLGYADGYRRALSNRGEMLVGGQRAKIAGLVSMDQLTLDVTDIPNLKVMDEVVLIGRQGEQEITLEEIATLCDTVNYEILTGLGNRIRRVYTYY